jgi:hypothetical protein
MTAGRSGALAGLLTLCAFYPFLPGEYDGMALPLSLVAQVVSVTGLLFVPVGALSLIHARWTRAGGKGLGPAGLIAYVIVAIVASGAAWSSSGRAFGCATLIGSAYILSKLWPGFKPSTSADPPKSVSTPLYLAAAAIVAVLLQVLLANSMIEFSRSRAIGSSAELIDDLERHHAAHGQYPKSLNGIWADYKVSVVGVSQFHYAPHGDAYNLYFEQPLPLLTAPGTREFVVYNPRNQHMMLSHAAWNVTRSPDALAHGQGWYAVHDLSRPHWKAFRFD